MEQNNNIPGWPQQVSIISLGSKTDWSTVINFGRVSDCLIIVSERWYRRRSLLWFNKWLKSFRILTNVISKSLNILSIWFLHFVFNSVFKCLILNHLGPELEAVATLYNLRFFLISLRISLDIQGARLFFFGIALGTTSLTTARKRSLRAGNCQKCNKSTFLICPCHKIWILGVDGLYLSNYT